MRNPTKAGNANLAMICVVVLVGIVAIPGMNALGSAARESIEGAARSEKNTRAGLSLTGRGQAALSTLVRQLADTTSDVAQDAVAIQRRFEAPIEIDRLVNGQGAEVAGGSITKRWLEEANKRRSKLTSPPSTPGPSYQGLLETVSATPYEIDGASHFNALPVDLRSEFRAAAIFARVLEPDILNRGNLPSRADRAVSLDVAERFILGLSDEGRAALSDPTSLVYEAFLDVASKEQNISLVDLKSENLLLGEALHRFLRRDQPVSPETIDQKRFYAEWLAARMRLDEEAMQAGGASLFKPRHDINDIQDTAPLDRYRYTEGIYGGVGSKRILSNAFETPSWYDGQAYTTDWTARSQRWRMLSDDVPSSELRKLVEPELRNFREQLRQTIELLRREKALERNIQIGWDPGFDARILEAESLLAQLEDLGAAERLSKTQYLQAIHDIMNRRSLLMIDHRHAGLTGSRNPREVTDRRVGTTRNVSGERIPQLDQTRRQPLTQQDYQYMPYATFGDFYWSYDMVIDWYRGGVFPVEYAADIKYFDGVLREPFALPKHDIDHVLRIVSNMRDWNEITQLMPELDEVIAHFSPEQRALLGETLWEVIIERVGSERGIPVRRYSNSVDSDFQQLGRLDAEVSETYLNFRDLAQSRQREAWRDRNKAVETWQR